MRGCNIDRDFWQGSGARSGLQHLPPAAARLGDAAAHNKALRVDDVGSVADAAGGKYWAGSAECVV